MKQVALVQGITNTGQNTRDAFYKSKGRTCKGLPFYDFISFMISSVAPTRSSTFYAYLITKIGYRNLKSIPLNCLSGPRIGVLHVPQAISSFDNAQN